MNGELCVQFLIFGEPSTKVFYELSEKNFVLFRMLNMKQEKKKEKKRQKEQGGFHIPQQ